MKNIKICKTSNIYAVIPKIWTYMQNKLFYAFSAKEIVQIFWAAYNEFEYINAYLSGLE